MSSTIEGRIEVATSLAGASTPYSLTVTASDGTNTANVQVTINVKTGITYKIMLQCNPA